MLDSVWGRAPAQHSTTPPQACDGQSQAAAPKSGVHRSGRTAAGMPNYDRLPLGHLLKLWDKAAPMQHPRLAGAGCPFRPLRACKHGETKQGLHGSARGEPSAIDTAAARRRAKPAAELKTNESAQSYPGAYDVQRRMQRGKRFRLDADRPLACRAGCERQQA